MSDQQAVTILANEVWDWTVRRNPYFALRAGRTVESFPLRTLEEAETDARHASSLLDRLHAVDPGALSNVDRLTHAYLRQSLAERARSHEAWWWSFPVAPYQLYEKGLYLQQVLMPFVFEDDTGDRYLGLLRDLAAGVHAMRDKLEAQVARGWGLPAPALAGFVAAVAAQRAAMSKGARMDGRDVDRLGASARETLAQRVDRLVDDELLPSYDGVLAYLEGPGRDTAVDGVGLSQYPRGEQAYRTLVQQYATYPVDPEELHATGAEQVASLTEQMAEVRAATRFDGTEAEYRHVLKADERFHAASSEDVAATYRRHIASVEPLVDGWFAVTPQAAHGIERLDPSMEAGMSYGYYEPPTSATPVGRYRFNGSGLDTRSQLNAAALILHELVPGHHFHLARQAEDKGLPRIRSEVAPLTLSAYTEGWAEYAASLGFEMGLYDDPFDRYGALVHQRFIAQRLVVDTGLNLLGWSLDEARDYMSRMTMESDEQVRAETLRYSTDLPGQALAYRVGWLKFWELRDRASKALGSDFDVRAFHEVILAPGALPLSLVEDNVDEWLAGA